MYRNILFINDQPFNPLIGGIERVTDLLAKAFIERGYNVFYLCGKVEDASLLDYDFPVRQDQFPESIYNPSDSNARFYKAYLRENDIQIVINQRGADEFGNFSLLPDNVREADVKIISVLHTAPMSYWYGTKVQIRERSGSTWTAYLKSVAKTCAYPYLVWKWKRIMLGRASKQYTYVLEHSDAFVLLSERFREELEQLTIPADLLKKTRICAIGNPFVNFSEKPSPSGEQKEKMLLYVGRLEYFQKRPRWLLRVWKLLYRQFPDWELRFVGDGPEREVLQNYVKRHGLPRVHFEGAQRDVAPYYKRASFVCLTSTFEGFGMVLIEGMSEGSIPVAFDSFKSVRDIIDNGHNGLLVPPFDKKAYAKSMAELMRDPQRRAGMMEAAREHVKKFDVANIVKQWENLFTTL